MCQQVAFIVITIFELIFLDPSLGSCSSKCLILAGNLQAIEKVDSAISWLLDACVEIGLMRREQVEEHGLNQAIDHWTDREKEVYKAAERYKTGGGITDVDFWTKLVANLPQHQVFVDFGSEYGLQGFLCALHGAFEEIVGIELNQDTFEKSVQLANCLMRRAIHENKFISKIELHIGDFLNHDAIIASTMRSTVVHTNNFVFKSDTTAMLVEMWRKHLPADATIVLFDETAIMSSGEGRTRRSHDATSWASKIGTIKTSVSWNPSKLYDVHLWKVSKAYTTLRDWASSAKFVDLLGWSIFNGRGRLIEGARKSSNWLEKIIVFSDWSTLQCQLQNIEMQQHTQGIFVVVTSSTETYNAERNKVSTKYQDESSRANLDSLCVLDCSEQHPVVEKLLQVIMAKKS